MKAVEVLSEAQVNPLVIPPVGSKEFTDSANYIKSIIDKVSKTGDADKFKNAVEVALNSTPGVKSYIKPSDYSTGALGGVLSSFANTDFATGSATLEPKLNNLIQAITSTWYQGRKELAASGKLGGGTVDKVREKIKTTIGVYPDDPNFLTTIYGGLMDKPPGSLAKLKSAFAKASIPLPP
jgi:hypothetical protein